MSVATVRMRSDMAIVFRLRLATWSQILEVTLVQICKIGPNDSILSVSEMRGEERGLWTCMPWARGQSAEAKPTV